MRPIYINLFLFIFVICLAPSVQAQELEWVSVEQSTGNEEGTAITLDKFGNVYHAGELSSAMIFGEGSRKATRLNAGNYVARYQPNGSFKWAANITTDGSPLIINGIGVDGAGDVYIAGRMTFGSNHTFGPGELNEVTISTNGNSSDVFVASFTKKGVFKWVRQGGLGEDNGASGIAVAKNGDNYITGFYRANIIFGEEGNTPPVELTSEGGELDNDIFIVKFDQQGDLVWAKTAGGAVGADTGFDIDLDGDQTLYVSGHFIDSATFGKNTVSELTITSDGSLDGFLVRMTSDGDPVWGLAFGGPGSEQVLSIDVKDGSIMTTGLFTAGFDLASTDASSLTLPVVLADNFFVARYDEDGVLHWGGAMYMDDLTGFDIDVAFGEDDQSCVISNFDGVGIFGLGQDGVTVLNAPGDPEMFFACYEDNGILAWAAADPPRMIAGTLNDEGEIFVTGRFQGSTDFGPGDPNEVTINSEGFNDLFVAKYQNQETELGLVWASEKSLEASLEAESLQALPDDFKLLGNYPNPFNPETTIRVHLNEDAAVSLVVYDALGREVSRLMDGVQEAGTHEVVFQANDLPSGLYLYKLVSPAGAQTRTMLLMK